MIETGMYQNISESMASSMHGYRQLYLEKLG